LSALVDPRFYVDAAALMPDITARAAAVGTTSPTGHASVDDDGGRGAGGEPHPGVPHLDRVPAWPLALLAGLIAAWVRLLITGEPADALVLVWGATCAGGMALLGARMTGRPRRAWLLLSLAVLGSAGSQVLGDLPGGGPGTLVTWASNLGYVPGAIGIVLLVRDMGESDPDAWLDASAVGIALSMVMFAFVVGPATVGGRGGELAFALTIAAVDAAILTTLVRIVLQQGRSVDILLLCSVFGFVLIVDAAYETGGLPGLAHAGYDAVWCLGYGACLGAALHPVARRAVVGGHTTPSIEQQIHHATVAVVLHSSAMTTVGLLVARSALAREAGLPVLMVAQVGLFAIAGVRSIRMVRHLADDVRQRRVAEEALQESEERFRRLAEGAPVGIFVSDADGRSVFQNDAWASAAGMSPAQGLGMGYAESVHPDDREWALGVWRESVRSGKPMSIEHRMLRPDGSTVWVHAQAVPMQGPGGRPAGWVGTVVDITRLKAAMTAAEEREAFFNGLIEQSPVGIGVYGLDGQLLGLNEAERRIRERIGASPEVPDVRSDQLMLRLGQGESIGRAYRGELAGGEPTATSVPVAGTTGAVEGERVWLRLRWYPLRGADGSLLAVISFAEDVTGTVEADVRERHVGEKLQEAAKLEALGVLAGGIAHDFNNLLVPIIGYVDLALAEAPPESSIIMDLEAARTAASRAADLARQMLAYSGRGAFTIGPAVLEDLLGEIGDLMGRSIAKGCRLNYAFTPGLPPVMADATQLRQVALNLVVNASDALEGQRGDITLRTAMTTLEPDDPDLVPGSSAEPGRYVMLEVSDTGSGMDDATRARIFDPFFSTKSVGRGLGLAATLGIVKGHGGAIRVRSVPGRGSTFQVLLRPTDAQGVELGDDGPKTHTSRTTTGRVLLVDDEPSVRQIGRRILERSGFTVDEAGDGPEAIDRFRADPGGFDTVLLDLTLPSLDGLAVMRELRVVRPGIPVVLCSGWSAEEVAGGLGSMPHTAFLKKPYQVHELVQALRQVAGEERQS
jgi:two-component system cell cycle sensor histidine kinase/response regulator CckA